MPQLSVTAFAVMICLCPWYIGGNYPYIRTFASSLIVLLLLIEAIHNLVKKPQYKTASKEASLVFAILLLVLAYCGLQTFFQGQIFSSALPFASRERLSELLFGFGFFVFGYRFFRNAANVTPFAIVVFINGALLAIFGIVQKLSWNGQLFWNYELVQGGVPFASFVNRNNAAGYLVICFAVANYFLARRLFSKSGSDDRKLPVQGFAQQIRSAIEDLEAKHLYLFSGLLLIAVAVLFSQSRGGALALLAAFLIGWLIMLKTNRLLIFAMLLFVSAGAAFVAYSDQSDDITQRLQSLSDVEEAGTPRLEHWSTVMPYVSDYLAVGSGIGTYQYVYPRYQQTEFRGWFRHAENQYIETVAELGILGIAALLAVIFFMFRACISQRTDTADRAVGIVGLMTLIGQAFAAVFDFGWYIPGNAMLMATVLGMVLARHCASVSTNSQAPDTRSTSKLLVVLTLLLLVGNAWAAYELSAVDSRILASHKIRKFAPERQVNDLDQYDALLQYSLNVRPDDAEAHYWMGQLNALKYRVSAAQKLLADITEIRAANQDEDESSTVDSDFDVTDTPDIDEVADVVAARGPVEVNVQTISDIWPTTSLVALNRAANVALRDTENPQAYDELLASESVDFLKLAWESFLSSEEHCPFLYRTQYQLAQLSVIGDRAQSERQRIETAISRCPLNASLLYNAGLIEHHARNSGVAAKYWGQVMQMTRKFDPQIILYSRYELSMKDFFNVILPADPELLYNVANKYFRSVDDQLPRQLLLNHTRGLLLKDAGRLARPENQFLLASIEAEFGEFANSNKHFENSLKSRPNEVSWRLAFARSLLLQQQNSESVKQLKACLVQPGRTAVQTREIQKLLRRLEKQGQIPAQIPR